MYLFNIVLFIWELVWLFILSLVRLICLVYCSHIKKSIWKRSFATIFDHLLIKLRIQIKREVIAFEHKNIIDEISHDPILLKPKLGNLSQLKPHNNLIDLKRILKQLQIQPTLILINGIEMNLIQSNTSGKVIIQNNAVDVAFAQRLDL